jgi:hypothetical protein
MRSYYVFYKHVINWSFILLSGLTVAQESAPINSGAREFYREDQFYIALSYDLLSEVPASVATRGLIGGFHFGFIRDWPINGQGTWSVGTGIGLGYDRYGQNVIAQSSQGADPIWTIEQSPSAIDNNSLQITALEVPIELRWRTSDARTYKFWRLYAGAKWSQHVAARAVFTGPEGSETLTDLPQLRKGIWYATVAFGYGIFNAQLQWGLTPLLLEVQDSETQQSIGLRPIKLGIMFYIL